MNPIDRMMDAVEWKACERPELPDGLYATHKGVLNIGGFTFQVYRLNDGQRVIDAGDFHAFFYDTEDYS